MRPGSAPQSPRDIRRPTAKEEEAKPRFGRFEAMPMDARGQEGEFHSLPPCDLPFYLSFPKPRHLAALLTGGGSDVMRWCLDELGGVNATDALADAHHGG